MLSGNQVYCPAKDVPLSKMLRQIQRLSEKERFDFTPFVKVVSLCVSKYSLRRVRKVLIRFIKCSWDEEGTGWDPCLC